MSELDVNMSEKIMEIADRVKGLRLDMELTTAEMAEKLGMTEAEYVTYENGEKDFNYSFLSKVAAMSEIDMQELMEGSSASLTEYTVTRKGEGRSIARRDGFKFERLGSRFRNKFFEPFHVVIPYSDDALNPPYEMHSHAGQEMFIITKGTLKVLLGDNSEILREGDSVFFDSMTPHYECAVGGEDCEFYSIIFNPEAWTEGKTRKETLKTELKTDSITNTDLATNVVDPVYKHFFWDEFDSTGKLTKVGFHKEACDKFNFGFDVVDEIAKKTPDKTAMMWVAKDGVTDHRFTFEEMSKRTNQAANYFKSLGIKKGDKVMLILKRHYQFWFSIVGLEKLGAVAIPATCLLREHDFDYRYKAAGVSAVVMTPDGDTAEEAMKAAKAMAANGEDAPTKFMMVNGARGEWLDFDKGIEECSDVFERPEDCSCGNEPMVMFFTSGTTGYPKMALHSHLYALGHITTAKHWHNVDPNGLHFTISDTGWGKALWGKIYGQWLCEAPIFTFDFDKFKSDEILPMFAKYGITTFCAPPTMFRFLVKEDLNKYDLSSIKYATTAGEALNPEVFNQWIKATGIRLMEGFGQTETTLAIANLVGSKIRMGSMGKPNPLYDIHILNADDKDCKPGETGEICIKTSEYVPTGLYSCYYRNEEKTTDAWHDGYYHTGDTAWMDEDGYIWYVGRIDDVIKSSGYRIGPFEIESVIMELPYVLECAVTGAPDPQGVRGIVVKATIVLVPGKAEASEELKKEIQNYVKEKTAPYKYPRIVEFVEELPKTISGKIRRTEIRSNDAAKND
ncbi:MAG: AMP-binding protein [Saccharofermentans sp.]|nr:AMP-binding protein [Saccharofermentans sp.]